MRLGPSFLKFLLDKHATLTLRDLECFDPEYARQLQRLLATRGYSELLDCTFEDLLPGGEERSVDETNKQGVHCARQLFDHLSMGLALVYSADLFLPLLPRRVCAAKGEPCSDRLASR